MLDLRNVDCMKLLEDDINFDLVITSHPYNTGKRKEYYSSTKLSDGKRIYKKEKRYDEYKDTKTESEYIDWTINLLNKVESKLNKNGVIAYNISYGNETPNTLWLLLGEIIKKTDFMIADFISWKKKTALPNTTSKNKMTRIVEPIFVFCRKSENLTFMSNKSVKSVSNKGQSFYEVFYNFIEAKNNDEVCNLNKATYSTDLVGKLLDFYCWEGATVFDPFSGTGTTALECSRRGVDFIGSEISEAQHNYALERIAKDCNQVDLFNLGGN